MGEGGDALHLNGVHLLMRVVEDSRGINDLPPHVTVIKVTDEERLGGEGVRLDVDVRASNLVNEGRLADIGVAADEECTGGRIDIGETGNVLTDLLEVGEWVFLPAHDSRHTAIILALLKS